MEKDDLFFFSLWGIIALPVLVGLVITWSLKVMLAQWMFAGWIIMSILSILS